MTIDQPHAAATWTLGQVTNDVIGGIGWARKLKVFILYRKTIFT